MKKERKSIEGGDLKQGRNNLCKNVIQLIKISEDLMVVLSFHKVERHITTRESPYKIKTTEWTPSVDWKFSR